MAGATRTLRFRAAWLVVGYALVGATAWGSLDPTPSHMAFTGGDKVAHGSVYALLTFWFGQLYPGLRRQLAVAAAFVGLGVALEFAQAYASIYRHFDWWDAATSAVGVVLAWAALRTRTGRTLAWLDGWLAGWVEP